MPSVALTEWTNDRMPRLAQVDGQCAANLALVPPNPILLDEILRGYAMLPSAHFQGYCRALYTECAHHRTAPPPSGMPSVLTHADLRIWRTSCDALASSLDDIMYNKLQHILGVRPW
jgi:hypothetical protein